MRNNEERLQETEGVSLYVCRKKGEEREIYINREVAERQI